MRGNPIADVAVIVAIVTFGGLLMIASVPLWVLSGLRALWRRIVQPEPTFIDPP